ncbi:hypothetical protein L2E82_49270 [Cichorium intybus]|uniref:Uncharacterized protein n=1 Tax=Cichorium intybus TaxID=13427 RepID=A0ACB8Z041_CICIN|nr:hypothetical protein L2E82_49270 [Cichorium intybus]
MEDQSLQVLELEQQLIELQIKKTKLLSKSSKVNTSLLPDNTTWAKGNQGNNSNYVTLGTIPRSTRNSNFPSKADELSQKQQTVSLPVIESIATSSTQVATTDRIPVKNSATPSQTVDGKELSNPFMLVALAKSKKNNRSSKNKPSSSNRKHPLPTEPKQKNKVLNLERASSDPFSFKRQQNKKWKPSAKRPLNPESLMFINSIFQYCPDISLMRTLEKSLYHNTKTTESPDISLQTIPANIECEFQINQLEQTVSNKDFENMVYPTFCFHKNRWTKLFEQIKENKLNEWFSESSSFCINNISDSRSLVSINKPSSCSPDFLWTIMNSGFLNTLVFNNKKWFKECPQIIRNFAEYNLKRERSKWMIISTSLVFQNPEGEHTVRFWTNPKNQPEIFPGTLILVEDPQDFFNKSRPFCPGYTIPNLMEDDQFHLAGVNETNTFLKEIEDNPGFKIHSQEGRVICYQINDNNLPHEDFVQLITDQFKQHSYLITWNEEIKAKDIIAEGKKSKAGGPDHKENISTNKSEDKAGEYNGPAKSRDLEESTSGQEDKAM